MEEETIHILFSKKLEEFDEEFLPYSKKTLQEIKAPSLVEELFKKSLFLEILESPDFYEQIRQDLQKNDLYPKIEGEVKERVFEKFGLIEEEQQGNSWLTTEFYYSLFIREHRNKKIKEWLVKKGFFLAREITDEDTILEERNISTRDTKMIWEDIYQLQCAAIKVLSTGFNKYSSKKIILRLLDRHLIISKFSIYFILQILLNSNLHHRNNGLG